MIQKDHHLIRLLISGALILSLSSCYWENIKWRESLRPVKKWLYKERTYWTDHVEYKGKSGSEIVYYKNGRPAMERLFDENGLLSTQQYFDRRGNLLRTDSLVYVEGIPIAAYYFSEPGHVLELREISYKQQGQLSQRSWFDGYSTLLSREFFLFDRQGQRRMRMIFDGNDSLLFTETFRAGSDELDIQNTYSVNNFLASQIRYRENPYPIRYTFDHDGRILSIDQLHKDLSIAWSNELTYDRSGAVSRSNFSTGSRVLVSHLGDLEFFQQQARSWKHPQQPGEKLKLIRYGHEEPFIRQKQVDFQDRNLVEYRFPRSGAVFKRSRMTNQGQMVSDTLYGIGASLRPAVIMDYDSAGSIVQELTMDLNGVPKWVKRWIRDSHGRSIREEVFAYPDTFYAAITRMYDVKDQLAVAERFDSGAQFEGTWVNYWGGGIKKTLFYDPASELTESWMLRPAGDTIRHSRFRSVDYFRLEARYGLKDTLRSQRRFTRDGLLNWELVFDGSDHLVKEVHRKKDGSLYKEIDIDLAARSTTATTYAPILPGEDPQNPNISAQVVSRFNTSGDLIQLISKNSSGEVEWEKRFAFRGGRLLKSAQLDPQGKPVIISEYTHNDSGLVLTETALDATGSEVHHIDYRYDELGQLIFKTFRSDLTSTLNSNRYYYDETGRLTRNEIIEAQRFVEAVEYEYFPQYFLRLATHLDPDGKPMRKEIENYFVKSIFETAEQVDKGAF